MSSTFDDLQKQYIKLYEENQYAHNQKSRFSYTYKPIPFPGDLFNDVTATYIGTFTPEKSGENKLTQSMIPLPMQQTAKTCLLNAAVIASKYVDETSLNSSAFGGTFTPSTLQSKSVTTNLLKRDVTQTTTTVGGVETFSVNGLNMKVLIGPENQYVDIYRNNGFSNGVNIFKTPSNHGFSVELNTNKMDLTTQGLILPTNFGNITTATSTNANNTSSSTITYSITPDTKHFFMIEWNGIFTPNITGNWSFFITSDDYAILWVDSNGSSIGDSYSMNNTTINNGDLHSIKTEWSRSLSFTAGTDYKIRFRFGEYGGLNNIVLGARNPSGVTVTDFTGLFFVKGSKDTTRTVTTDNISYSLGEKQTRQSQSLASEYNSSYSTNDPNPVFVSMIKDDTTKLYDCYINQPSNGSIKDVLSSAANNSKYLIKTLWKSAYQGSLYFNNATSPGVATISNTAGVFIDGTKQLNSVIDTTGASYSLPNVIFKDGQHYMYIHESQRIYGSKLCYVPVIVIVNVSNNKKWILDVNTMTTDPNVPILFNYQVPLIEWTTNPQFLLYDIDNVGDNTSSILGLNALVKIYGNFSVSSANGYFNLTMVDGYLTIQMAIDPTLDLDSTTDKIDGINNVKFVKKNIVTKDNSTPNTYPLMKVSVNTNVDQLNLLDNNLSSGFYIPKKYVEKSKSKYTSYSGAIPYLPSGGGENNITTDDAATCKSKCDNDPNCDAYYTYLNNSQNGCKLQSFSDKADQAYFNPPQYNGKITSSTLNIKNKEIISTYNEVDVDIKQTVLGQNERMNNTKLPYYPDTPSLNYVNGYPNYFDQIKKYIGETNNSLNTFQNDPKNYTSNINISPVIDMSGYVSSQLSASMGYEDYLQLLKKEKEGFTSLYLDQNVLSPADYQQAQSALQNNDCQYGICNTLNTLQGVNTNYNKVIRNDKVLGDNTVDIYGKIRETDYRFKNLSDFKSENGSVNPYAADFNGFDDSPDSTVQGAIKKDLNEMLLYQNSLYIIGTIATASLLILAISMAK